MVISVRLQGLEAMDMLKNLERRAFLHIATLKSVITRGKCNHFGCSGDELYYFKLAVIKTPRRII